MESPPVAANNHLTLEELCKPDSKTGYKGVIEAKPGKPKPFMRIRGSVRSRAFMRLRKQLHAHSLSLSTEIAHGLSGLVIVASVERYKKLCTAANVAYLLMQIQFASVCAGKE